MDYEIDLHFNQLLKFLEVEKDFGPGLDLQAVLLLIGVDILGQGHRKFSKNEKLDLMHIAICTILEPYGYYSFEGNDKDNWPHFKLEKELPHLNDREQKHLLKQAVLEYFKKEEIFTI
jgi:hypothetical protein